jgi:GNAT superfamily N-acetyltransferase
MQNHYAQIIDFIVTAAHRKKGVGTKLMDAAKEWAKKRGLDYIELFVLSGAIDERSFLDSLMRSGAWRTYCIYIRRSLMTTVYLYMSSMGWARIMSISAILAT